MSVSAETPVQSAKEYMLQTAQESIAIKEEFLKEYGTRLVQAAQCIAEAVNTGHKILIFGNGGSAADAQHMAAEMVGRMLIERRPLPAIALTTDTSNITAIGNDYGYDVIFKKQVEALAQSGDVVVALSTSGNSKNVLLAVEVAKARGCKVIGVAGGSGGRLKEVSDLALIAERGKNSSRIQETHIFIVHSLVDLCDRFFLEKK
jgi:D-sedoheptulose 7-phosphate isomerase